MFENEESKVGKDFFLNGILVTPLSGQIHMSQGTVTLEPKVMDVLVVLAKHPGTVISAENIFDIVWPKSIYSPVSVRRSVNQLRNALHDTDKSIITTHPKRGYALQADISFPQQGCEEKVLAEDKIFNPKAWIWSGVVLLMVTMATLLFSMSTDNHAIDVRNLQPLTATADEESYAIYTPDDKYLIYVKNTSGSDGLSQLWLSSVDRRYQQLVYESSAEMRYFTWITNGSGELTRQLVVAEEHDNLSRFFTIMFDPLYRVTSTLSHFDIRDAQVLSPFVSYQSDVFFVAKTSVARKVFKGDLMTGKLTEVLTPSAGFQPYRIAPAATENEVAVIGFNQYQVSELNMLDVKSGALTPLKTLDSNWYFLAYSSVFDDYLLSDGKGLFHLSHDNLIAAVPFENVDFLRFPSLAQSGRALAYTQQHITGHLFSLELETGKVQQVTDSRRHDWLGHFSPDGTKVAYISNKNGYSQVFIRNVYEAEEQLVYSNNGLYLGLSAPVWSDSGERIAFARNSHLVVVDLTDMTQQPVYFDDVIGVPVQWRENRILIQRKSYPQNRWFEVDEDGHAEELLQQNSRGMVFHNGQLLTVSESQLSDASGEIVYEVKSGAQIFKHFVDEDSIYLVLKPSDKSEPMEVWRVLPDVKSAEMITELEGFDGHISDIRNNKLLFSSFESQQDIVTLDLLR